jgi:hypothetical protein
MRLVGPCKWLSAHGLLMSHVPLFMARASPILQIPDTISFWILARIISFRSAQNRTCINSFCGIKFKLEVRANDISWHSFVCLTHPITSQCQFNLRNKSI